ncbi:MAG: ribosome small subunit-dependent GTPase A [Clostridia bacterium]|nr:ribosome small subunit-dependent GTPase A [Clostridia bacterium]
MQGTIVKGIAGFYYVWADNNIYECKAKGVFRKKGLTPLAGDKVELEINADGSGTVAKILERRNFFDRPPVANVECFVLVAAAKDPLPSFLMLDRFCVMAEKANAELIICLNKGDLAEEKMIEDFKKAYDGIYKLFVISAKEGKGIEELKAAIMGKQVALAGPSGVGKSTLTNLLIGEGSSVTGEISDRLARGKNTTRHTELFKGDGFFLFDTPGFTSFEAELEDEGQLASLFPEFENYLGECKFNDCRHIKEPGCRIREALEKGEIHKTRYDSYLDIFTAIKNNKRL